MFEIIKQVIDSARYELSDILKKIDTVWIQGALTDEEKNNLVNLARTNAKPENSYAPLQEQITELHARMDELSARIDALESGTSETPDEPTDEYPPYVQPTGAHDAYNTGDKITYNGKKYECLMNGCVWSPDDYPQGWKEVTE